MGKSLNDIKRDIALLTLEIECLDPDSKHSAIAHLEETIDLLKLGAEHDLASLANQDLSEEKQQSKVVDEPSKDENSWMFNDDTFIDDIDYESNITLEESVPENESNFDQGNNEKMEISTHQVPNNEIKQEPVNQEPVVISLNPDTFQGQIDSVNDMFKCEPCNVYLPRSFTLQRHEQDPKHQAKVATPPVLQTNDILVDELQEEGFKQMQVLCRQKIDESTELNKDANISEPELENQGIERTTALKKETFQHGLEDSKLIQCPKCPNQYNKRNSFLRHQIMHTGKYKCQRCQAAFGERSKLDKHSRNPLNCTKLKKLRSSTIVPVNEKSNVHSKQETVLPTSTSLDLASSSNSQQETVLPTSTSLDSASSSNSKLEIVLPTSTSLASASSPASQQQAVLSTSTPVDSKGLLLQCPKCSKLYSNEHSLRNHMPIHTDKYKCPKCESRFAGPSNLAKHNCESTLKRRSEDFVITGIAVAECQECGMRFGRQESFRNHKIEHTDMFKCASCSVSFRGRNELARHNRNKDTCKSILIKREALIRRTRLLYSAPVHNPSTKPSEIKSDTTSTEQKASEALTKPEVINEQNPKDQTLEILQQTFSGITFRAKNRTHS